jgi:putative flippase GtrA
MELLTSHPLLIKFLKFAVVGAMGLVIDFGVTYLCKEKLRFNKYIANATGFFISGANNFLLNRSWTFANNDPHIWEQYAKFVSFALIGLLINSTIIWFLHGQQKRNFYFSKAVATAVVMAWNFTSNILFTFP